jgi:hypothetical protein
MKAELRDLKVAYASLKDNMQGVVLQLATLKGSFKQLKMKWMP